MRPTHPTRKASVCVSISVDPFLGAAFSVLGGDAAPPEAAERLLALLAMLLCQTRRPSDHSDEQRRQRNANRSENPPLRLRRSHLSTPRLPADLGETRVDDSALDV